MRVDVRWDKPVPGKTWPIAGVDTQTAVLATVKEAIVTTEDRKAKRGRRMFEEGVEDALVGLAGKTLPDAPLLAPPPNLSSEIELMEDDEEIASLEAQLAARRAALAKKKGGEQAAQTGNAAQTQQQAESKEEPAADGDQVHECTFIRARPVYTDPSKAYLPTRVSIQGGPFECTFPPQSELV